MAQENTPARDLFNLLVGKDFDPKSLDEKGKNVSNVDDASIISFQYSSANKNYGTVVLLLDSENNLNLFFGDNLGKGMNPEDRSDWYDFLYQLRMIAKRNLLGFSLQNLSRLKYTMQGMAAIGEGLFEGYYGTRKTSYTDQPKKTRLVIKHSRPLGETDARFRHVESLFVENDQGERFKLPFANLAGGRAMARHVAEGGTPYDTFGQHISSLVAEAQVLSRFLRTARNKNLNEDAAAMVEGAVSHYNTLRKNIKKLSGTRGYREYSESWNPSQSQPHEDLVEQLKGLFQEQQIDSRIEAALPILAKLKEKKDTTDMKEITEFEQWADQMTEGTWSLPNTLATQKELVELLQDPITVGPDGMDAIDQLHDVFGDDTLFDQISALADQDPEADARPLISARLEELGIEIEGLENVNVDGEDDQLGQSMPDLDSDSEPDQDLEEIKDIDTGQEIGESDFGRLVQLINY